MGLYLHPLREVYNPALTLFRMKTYENPGEGGISTYRTMLRKLGRPPRPDRGRFHAS
jgi:hypothetical protein